MNFGLYLPNFGAFGDPKTLISLAIDAEESGWDGFFIWDHIAGFDNTMIDPWVGLALVANATKRLRIGTMVTPLSRRRPHKLARETVSVDHVSNGRLVLGVGSGEGLGEYGNLGEEADHPVRGDMVDEALDVITQLWSGNRVNFSGTHYRIEDTIFRPGPIQTPRIPVWVGGFWPNRRPMRRAAKWDGVIPLIDVRGNESELEAFVACVEYVQSQRASEEPFDVIYTGITTGDDQTRDQELVAEYRQAGATWWLEAIAPYRYDEGFEEPWDLPRLRERVLQGPTQL